MTNTTLDKVYEGDIIVTSSGPAEITFIDHDKEGKKYYVCEVLSDGGIIFLYYCPGRFTLKLDQEEVSECMISSRRIR